MRKINLLGALAIVFLGTTLMSAQASRTWVSGVGDDVNPCSRNAPCKTFAGAISKTAAGGEIDALDPGGFGAVTITKGITIDGGGGQVASVLVAGGNGIVVQAGPSDVVILRNLRVNGIGVGVNGVKFNSGKSLDVENCFIFGFTTQGIDITLNQNTQASVHIINTVIKNVGGDGVRSTNAQTPAVQVGIDNSYALLVGGVGFEAQQHSRMAITNSAAENGTDGMKADDLGGTSDAFMIVSDSEASYNTNGVSSASGAIVQVGGSTAAYNGSCAFNQGAGSTLQFMSGTNRTPGAPLCGAPTGIGQT
ncbi:MAG TPA: hypothetical protein VJA94_19790 [Candidatus Angelobacter sp.]